MLHDFLVACNTIGHFLFLEILSFHILWSLLVFLQQPLPGFIVSFYDIIIVCLVNFLNKICKVCILCHVWPLKYLLFSPAFLSVLWHMAFPSKGSKLSWSCDLYHRGPNARSWTHCSRLGIELAYLLLQRHCWSHCITAETPKVSVWWVNWSDNDQHRFP